MPLSDYNSQPVYPKKYPVAIVREFLSSISDRLSVSKIKTELLTELPPHVESVKLYLEMDLESEYLFESFEHVTSHYVWPNIARIIEAFPATPKLGFLTTGECCSGSENYQGCLLEFDFDEITNKLVIKTKVVGIDYVGKLTVIKLEKK